MGEGFFFFYWDFRKPCKQGDIGTKTPKEDREEDTKISLLVKEPSTDPENGTVSGIQGPKRSGCLEGSEQEGEG